MDVYVSPQGNDSNPGTSEQPFLTIAHAYASAAPGLRIIAMPGVYFEYASGWGLHLNANGAPCSPIVLKSQVKGAAILDGQNAPDRNLGIFLDGSDNIVDGFEIRNNPNGGISVWGDHNQILNCEIDHNGNLSSTNANGKNGVYSGPETRGNVYSANSIHDNGRPGSNLDHGLYLCGKDELVFNNVIAGNACAGIQVAGYQTVSHLRIYNNVMAWNGTDGIVLWQQLSGIDIKNNIFCNNERYGVGSFDAHGTGVALDHNLSFGNGQGDYELGGGGSDFSYLLGTTIQASPSLIDLNLGGFDAHLSAGSSAINAGVNLASVFSTDKDGSARPASGPWDIGAYRYFSSQGIILTSPADDSTVSGSAVGVSAMITGLLDIGSVQFQVDGDALGPPLLLAPYQASWDSTTVADGPHFLTAVARGLLGFQDIAAPITVMVSNQVPSALALSQTFGSISGELSGPFYVTSNAVVQPAFTSLESSGRAAYCFTVPTTGDYLVSAEVTTAGTNGNSFFIDVDAEPTDPATIWDIPSSDGTTNRVVSWRGGGTAPAAEFPKLFHLPAGAHQLIVRGRSAGCALGNITIELAPTVSLALSGGFLEISWPSALSGYFVETKPLLDLTSSWSAVTNVPALIGNRYQLIEPIKLGARIYRLHRR